MLAVRIWLPDDAEQNPIPAILEYLPYRQRDGTYERDALTHPYLAGTESPACASFKRFRRVGRLSVEEYAKQEPDAGVEVIAWLAAQPWCNGAVGKMGVSRGDLMCFRCGGPFAGAGSHRNDLLDRRSIR